MSPPRIPDQESSTNPKGEEIVIPAITTRAKSTMGVLAIRYGAAIREFGANYGPSGRNMPMLPAIGLAYKAHRQSKEDLKATTDTTDESQSLSTSEELQSSSESLPPQDI